MPTPKPPRKRIVVSGLLGALAGLIIFGPTGFLVGYRTAPAPAPKVSASPTATLPAFERAQVGLNKPKFSGELVPIAEPWLPYLTNCSRSGDKGGPSLNEGEDTRVFCRYANASVYFVEYKSIDARDKARTKVLAQNIDAKQLTPGVAEPGTKKTTSGKVEGNYIEYAFRNPGDSTNRVVCGTWWDDADSPVAAYIIAFWTDGIGESWEPLRDVWRRYS
ncbi:hypothetical protein ACNTMW_09425 [Planosporangium sp. 12N6]|uniref:hypothetical protein n=1 Tax=Planosporangium spinosum TaxID=3402278 RepID=UPI003CF9030F